MLTFKNWWGIFLILPLALAGGGRHWASAQGRLDSKVEALPDQPQAMDLLKKVSATYRGLNDYRFKMQVQTLIKANSMQRSLETDIDFSASLPGQFRIVMSGGLGEVHSISNGSVTWMYLPELKQYRHWAGSQTAANPEQPRDRDSHLTDMAKQIARQHERIADRVVSSNVLRSEVVTLEDKPVACWVVEAELENGEEGEKSLRTYWIDKERFLVLKAIQSVQVEASAESGPMETRITTTLSWARIHEDFPDSWFVFQPPQDAKQVAEFRSLRAGGADSIGQPAADFTLRDLAGTEIQLKSLRGQVVLLNFWASWCGPCRLEMPVIEKLHHEFKDKGLQVFGINDEDVETIREYLSEFEYTFPTLVDEGQQVARLYRVRGIPTMVVIDRAGTVSHYRVGLSRERDLRGWLKTAGIE